MPAVENGEVFVRAPAGVKVNVEAAPYPDSATIEVCDGSACKRLKLRPQKEELLNVLRLVTVLPDRHTVLVGLGFEPRGADALERYDLEKPSAPPLRIPIPLKRQCGELLDVLGNNWLLQASVCMNTGAQRLLVTPTGAVIADLGTYTADSPYFALGNNRWLFQSYDGLAIWDLAKGKRVAFAKRTTDSITHYVAVLGGKMVEVEREGTIVSWDASLGRRQLGAIPRCPD